MKNKITTNLFLKVLSVIMAFLFWLVIINMIDPTVAKTFRDIPVEILNENVITSANQVFEVESGDTVNVTVKGKRSFVETLSPRDFTAVADLSELSKVNAVSINVQLKKQSNSNVELDWGSAVLKVQLEQRETKKFRVEVTHQGELSENYVLGNIVAQPNIVEVSCGESKFKKIDHVGVVVTLNGESEDFEKQYKPVLYNKDGEVLDNENVTFSNDTIRVLPQRRFRSMWSRWTVRRRDTGWYRRITNRRQCRYMAPGRHCAGRNPLRYPSVWPVPKRTWRERSI